MVVNSRYCSRQGLLYLLVFVHVTAVNVGSVGWTAEHLYDGVEIVP